MSFWLYCTPLISALIGYLFNRWIFSYSIRYYLLHQKKALGDMLATKAEQLLPLSKIEEKMGDPTLIEKAMPMIDQHIDEFLNVKLPQEIPMLGMFVGNKTTDKIKDVFIAQLKALFPKVMGTFATDFKNNLRIKERISAELENTDMNILIKNKLRAPAQKFAWAGFALGLFIGVLYILLFCLYIQPS